MQCLGRSKAATSGCGFAADMLEASSTVCGSVPLNTSRRVCVHKLQRPGAFSGLATGRRRATPKDREAHGCGLAVRKDDSSREIAGNTRCDTHSTAVLCTHTNTAGVAMTRSRPLCIADERILSDRVSAHMRRTRQQTVAL